jgi:hypothetical protein
VASQTHSSSRFSNLSNRCTSSGDLAQLVSAWLSFCKPPFTPLTPVLNLTQPSILIGYLISYFSYLPSIHHFRGQRRNGVPLKPEVHLWWLLFLAPLEAIGLFGFAWTSSGPDHGIPWIAPMIFSTFIAIANVSCSPLIIRINNLTTR